MYIVIVRTEDSESHIMMYDNEPIKKDILDDFFSEMGRIYDREENESCISYTITKIQKDKRVNWIG